MATPSPKHAALALALALAGALGIAACADRASPGENPIPTLRRDVDGLTAAEVEERIRAGSYTYLHLASLTDDRRRWAAVMGEGAPAGEQVRVRHFGSRSHFHSRRLDRTFERLDFVLITPLENRP